MTHFLQIFDKLPFMGFRGILDMLFPTYLSGMQRKSFVLEFFEGLTL